MEPVSTANEGEPQVTHQASAQVSAQVADWSRESAGFWEWAPSRSLLASIRCYQAWEGRWGVIGHLVRKLAVLRHRFWSVVTGAEIPMNCQIGGGLMLPHPTGVVIHPAALIGPNCIIFQHATLGTRSGSGAPVLGGHVDIGPGACVLGGVHLGDHARVGANAVVIHDVPAGATAVGVPAVNLPERP